MKIKTSDVTAQTVLTEKDINLLKKRMNAGEAFELAEEYAITEEQTEKGLAWLNNLRKTPTGAERKNNPYGYREEEALDTFTHFTFDGFADVGNQFVHFYVPIYTVHGKESSFQYHIKAGGISIIG